MSSSALLDSLRDLVTPDLVSRTSALLGESEGAVEKAFRAAFPAILAGLVQNADDPSSMERVLALANDPSLQASAPHDLAAAIASGGTESPALELGRRLLALVFGDRTDAMTSAIAGHSGLQSRTASSLLALAAPLVLGVVREHAARGGLDAAALGRWILGQRDAILAAVPPAVAEVVGVEPTRRPESLGAAPSAPRSSWVWPLAAILVALGLWALLRAPDRASAPDAELPPVAATPPAAGMGAPVVRALPNGVEIEVPANGLETELIVLIEDPNRPVKPPTWLAFDRLAFEPGSATLLPESRDQLADVASILQAYPSVKVKVGGYTDDTGDAAANQRLSKDRADSVVLELVALGIQPARLEAEGFGQDRPLADNDTEAGRAKNRRVALRLTEK
jgi:outer membrane protein OmpA-like peptidoglycan-associated protein